MADYDDGESRKIFSRIPQRICELDERNAQLAAKQIGQLTQEMEILFTEKQAELSQLFLLDNLTIFQTTQLLAWSNDFSARCTDRTPHDLDLILTAHFEKFKSTLPIVQNALASGDLAYQTASTDGLSPATKNPEITIKRSDIRAWLLKKPGFFASGFFPEVSRLEDWEPVRLRLLLECEGGEDAPPPGIVMAPAGNLPVGSVFTFKREGLDSLLEVYPRPTISPSASERDSRNHPKQTDYIETKFKEYIAEPAQGPGEEFDSAFDELMRLKAIERKIEDLRTLQEDNAVTKIGILEREVEAIRDWIDHKRETPTIGDTLLASFNLQCETHPPALDAFEVEIPAGASTTKGVIAVPAGTEWHDITFRFEDYENVRINIKGQYWERNFKSFKFTCNKTTNNASKLWFAMLVLAIYKGAPPQHEDGISKKKVSDIRNGLKAVFPSVIGDPIGHHRRGKGWPLKINLCVSKNIPARPNLP